MIDTRSLFDTQAVAIDECHNYDVITQGLLLVHHFIIGFVLVDKILIESWCVDS